MTIKDSMLFKTPKKRSSWEVNTMDVAMTVGLRFATNDGLYDIRLSDEELDNTIKAAECLFEYLDGLRRKD